MCVPSMKGLLTTENVDITDHNPSARTAKDFFHGTAVSLRQHPSHDSPGIPVAISAEDLHAPVVNSQAKASTDLIGLFKQSECEWLEWVYELLKKETLGDEDYISWSADFVTMQPSFT